jgi:hypothetical protein
LRHGCCDCGRAEEGLVPEPQEHSVM